jgi:hypothetical protein
LKELAVICSHGTIRKKRTFILGNMVRMRQSRAAQYMLATLLLFVGTLSGAAACALNLCKSECPMHELAVQQPQHSCCDEQAPEKAEAPECGCVIKATPVANTSPHPFVVISTGLDLLSPERILGIEEGTVAETCGPRWLVVTSPPTGPPLDEHGSRAPPLL